MELKVLPGIQKIVAAAAIGFAAIVSTVEAKKEVITSSSAGGSVATHVLTATARDAAAYQSTVTATVPVMNTVESPVPPIPELANWQARMVYYGAQHCDPGSIAWAIGIQGVNTEDNVWYYDGTKVYQQIAQYTHDPRWYTCAAYTNNAYKSWVLAVTEGVTGSTSALGGWRVFPDGLANDYWRTGDASSKEAAVRLALHSAYAWSGGAAVCGLSRETAYILNAYVVSEELGEPRNPMYWTAVDNALAQLQKSFVTGECTLIAPFMMGLTMEALIHHAERTGDSRVLPAIETAADALWAGLWYAPMESFAYTNNNLNDGAPDLNLLIAPAYAWLWHITGAQRHLDRGDAVFAGGVRRAWLGAGKAFSQNYRSSSNYVKWRSELPLTAPPPPPPPPPPTGSVSLASGAVTITWSGIATPTPTDWIGVFEPNGTDQQYLGWIYVNCSQAASVARASGSCQMPALSASGTYEYRLFAENSFTRLAVLGQITVTANAATTTAAISTATASAAAEADPVARLCWNRSDRDKSGRPDACLHAVVVGGSLHS
jgi:hypothetical protein